MLRFIHLLPLEQQFFVLKHDEMPRGKSETPVLRSTTGVQGSTAEVRWEYDGSAMGVRWEYDGSTMRVRWEYDESTREYGSLAFFPLRNVLIQLLFVCFKVNKIL